MSDVKLSLLIVAHNEAGQIADCIKSGAFADEIVVLLDRSTDETGSIAEKLGARLVKGAWPDEGERRSAGIDACTGDWILELDGDERVTVDLANEITETLQSLAADYFVISFRNYVGDRYVQYGWGAYNGVGGKTALFRRGKKQWHGGTVHPKITLDGQRGEMSNGIDHFVDDDLSSAGIDACTGDWILELDGDERVTVDLANEITETLQSLAADYFVISFRNYVGDRYVQYGWGAYNGVGGKTALFRRGKKQWHGGTVHPKITLDGQRGEMSNGIDHFVDDDLTSMYARLNSYSTAAAADAVAAGAVPGGLSTFRRFFPQCMPV